LYHSLLIYIFSLLTGSMGQQLVRVSTRDWDKHPKHREEEN